MSTADVDAVVAEAYAHVADGYEHALTVPGLPLEEADDLRACLRAARQIAHKPQIVSVSG